MIYFQILYDSSSLAKVSANQQSLFPFSLLKKKQFSIRLKLFLHK